MMVKSLALKSLHAGSISVVDGQRKREMPPGFHASVDLCQLAASSHNLFGHGLVLLRPIEWKE